MKVYNNSFRASITIFSCTPIYANQLITDFITDRISTVKCPLNLIGDDNTGPGVLNNIYYIYFYEG